MSLDKRLDPNKTPFDYFDEYMLELHKGWAEKWQNKTYKSKDELSKLLGVTSVTSYVFALAGHCYGEDYSFVAFPLIAGLGGIFDLGSKFFGSSSSRNEFFENSLVKSQVPLVIFVGAAYFSLGITETVSSIYQRDNDSLIRGVSNLSFGVGALSYLSGSYIDRVEIDDPPKKPRKERFSEKIKRLAAYILPKESYGQIFPIDF